MLYKVIEGTLQQPPINYTLPTGEKIFNFNKCPENVIRSQGFTDQLIEGDPSENRSYYEQRVNLIVYHPSLEELEIRAAQDIQTSE